MNAIQALAALISLTAVLAYLNHRYVGQPMTIGLMALSLLVGLAVLGLEHWGVPAALAMDRLVSGVDFSGLLLHGVLGLMLFAGALHVDLEELAERGLEIGLFATLGVAASTALVGLGAWGVSLALGLGLRPVECFLFGALISPTDPIAVLAMLKRLGAPKGLSIKMAGESLFNDGIGVVVFLVLHEAAYGGHAPGAGQAAWLLLTEAVGGAAFGLAAGYLVYRLLRRVDNYQVEVLLTLALVMGGYSLAGALHLSGPIAVVVAGLLVGNHGRRLAMSNVTVEHLDTFWELVDEILNALLFVLIGLEVLVLSLDGRHLAAGALAVPVVLAARLVSLGAPVALLSRWRSYSPGLVRVMTWGGLRGGISVALALSLPAGPAREAMLTMTYLVVAFAMLVQGPTLSLVLRRAGSAGQES